MKLSKDNKLELIKLARRTIRTILDGKSINEMEFDEHTMPDALKAKRGVFVTLHKDHDLRGCIGYILPLLPLWQATIENARNSAFRDPRFPPLDPKELDSISVEISVLTVPKKIHDISDFRIGKDGIILKKEFHQAVFLPQVAPEQGWDAKTTLTHLSQKAGLEPDGWKAADSLETFQAEVFSEEDLNQEGLIRG
jgi:AmmeMemoRadiSam system protein A